MAARRCGVIAVSAARPATASSSPTTPSTAPTRATHCYTPRPSGAPSPPPWTRSPARPGTAVRIFANVERKDDPRYPDRDPAYFVNRFRRHFAAHLWPGKRLPDLFMNSLINVDSTIHATRHILGPMTDDEASFVSGLSLIHI